MVLGELQEKKQELLGSEKMKVSERKIYDGLLIDHFVVHSKKYGTLLCMLRWLPNNC